MNNIWVWLIGLAVSAAAIGTIYFQQNEIKVLKNNKVLLEQKIEDLNAKVDLGVKERIRLNEQMQALIDKKAEIEVKYVTKKVTVYKDIIKTEPPEVIEAAANKEINETFNSITTNAVNYSLHNN